MPRVPRGLEIHPFVIVNAAPRADIPAAGAGFGWLTYGARMKVLAERLDTGHRYRRAGRIAINAPIQVVFDLVADPRRHADFDGSGTVHGTLTEAERLSLGATFGMSMRIGLPYRITNTVEEFDEPTRIAWRHLGRHRWRYEFRAIDADTTEVTETFDGSTSLLPPALDLMNAYDNNEIAILKTLVRLKTLAEDESS